MFSFVLVVAGSIVSLVLMEEDKGDESALESSFLLVFSSVTACNGFTVFATHLSRVAQPSVV
jgi:hypothetical protein